MLAGRQTYRHAHRNTSHRCQTITLVFLVAAENPVYYFSISWPCRLICVRFHVLVMLNKIFQFLGDPLQVTVRPSMLRDRCPVCLLRWCCGQTAGWIKMPFGMEIGLGPSDIVRWGPSCLPKGAQQLPHFSAHVYCDQTDGWNRIPKCWYHLVRMQASVQATLCQILDRDPAAPRKGAQHCQQAPHFSAHVYCGQVVAYLSNY